MKKKLRPIPLFTVLTFLLSFLLFGSVQGNNSAESKKILHINSYNAGYSWSDSTMKGIHNTFKGEYIELFSEHLDAMHFKKSKFDITAKYIQQKYINTKFNCIIVNDNDALDFVIQYGDLLFPSIPVFFCGINNPESYNFEGSRFFGYIENTNARKMLELASLILSTEKNVFIITDTTTTSGKINKDDYISQRRNFPNLILNFPQNMDPEFILQQVKNGNAGGIVINLGISFDKFGKSIDLLNFNKQLSEFSQKPVLSIWENSLGDGIIGGYINKGTEQGANVATLALKFLRNNSLVGFKHINDVNGIAYFDYHALKKFGISEKNLPENSVVLNKPHLQYLRYMLILMAISLGLLGIVVSLAFNIKKRRIAEKIIQSQIIEIQDQNAQLEESYQEMIDLNNELEETNAKLNHTNISLLEAKQKAEESERLKSSFLANMSHEIRTPLNAIVGFSSLLIDTENDAEKRSNYVNIINSNSESLLTLIDDILDLSKIEASQLSLHLEMVQVEDIFFEMSQLLNLRNKNRIDIRVYSDTIQNTLTLYTDKVRIRQIFTNLLTNALKFTEKGFIELGYHLDNPGEITFYVSDSGIGIDEHFQKTIFDRFTKIENHDKLYPGTGLGLAITKRLVEMLGGKIWLQSNIGKGSTFFFTHPLPPC